MAIEMSLELFGNLRKKPIVTGRLNAGKIFMRGIVTNSDSMIIGPVRAREVIGSGPGLALFFSQACF